MTTVGYGDFFPRSIIGRILISFIAIWGFYTVSLLVVVLKTTLSLSNLEDRALNVLTCVEMKTELRQRAAYIITMRAKIS